MKNNWKCYMSTCLQALQKKNIQTWMQFYGLLPVVDICFSGQFLPNKNQELVKKSLEPDLNHRGLVDDEQLEVLYEYLLAGIVEENYSYLDAIICYNTTGRYQLLGFLLPNKNPELSKKSLEPDLNQRPKDICKSTILQSSALPIELSRVG